ncbi:uncharacterized protein V1510DRAFT_106434 [Dipodascopsis tothii]|uniref:uncharacterized protein n=1 Tax=Dipodascopsis tothii TaxID=44089 RepID=UPI0034CE664D
MKYLPQYPLSTAPSANMLSLSDDVSSFLCFDDYMAPQSPLIADLSMKESAAPAGLSLFTGDAADAASLSFDWPSKADLPGPASSKWPGDLNASLSSPVLPGYGPAAPGLADTTETLTTPVAPVFSFAPFGAAPTQFDGSLLFTPNGSAVSSAAANAPISLGPVAPVGMPLNMDMFGGLEGYAASVGLAGVEQAKRGRLSHDFSSISSVASSALGSEFSTPPSSPSVLNYANNMPFLVSSLPSPPGLIRYDGSSSVSSSSSTSSASSPTSMSAGGLSASAAASAAHGVRYASLVLGVSGAGPTANTMNKPRTIRKQSESRIPLPDLHARMGLAHDPEEARAREQHILRILQEQGFPLGERTWIRDTDEKERRRVIEEIYRQTYDLYGYERNLLEVIARRGAYYLMQGRLRRLRRSKKHASKHASGSKAASPEPSLSADVSAAASPAASSGPSQGPSPASAADVENTVDFAADAATFSPAVASTTATKADLTGMDSLDENDLDDLDINLADELDLAGSDH